MGFIKYELLNKTYENDPHMIEVINGIKQLDKYHLLRNCEHPSKKLEELPASMNEYVKWMKCCDGGYLFSTSLLSFDGYDQDLHQEFNTFDAVNSKENYSTYGLPDGFFIIALLNYGDPVCMTSKDKKVRLWGTEENMFITTWNSFADYLGDELNEAIDMVHNGSLSPIPLK